MSDDVLILPPQRDLPPAELARRKKHLISEARAEVSAQSSRPLWWRRRTSRRRVPRIAIAATLAVAVLLSIPALGVAQRFASWLADLKGPVNRSRRRVTSSSPPVLPACHGCSSPPPATRGSACS